MRVRQAELCEEVYRALCRLEAKTGPSVDITRRNLMEAAGWAVKDLNVREADVRFGTRLDNALAYLREWGLVVERQALYEPNGEGRCIVVTLPAGVAQSVRASRSVSRFPRRSSFSGELGVPPWGDIRGGGDSCLSRSPRRERLPRACARGSADATVRPSLSSVRSALAAARLSAGLEGSEPTGVRLLEKVPALVDAPPSLLLRAAWAEAGHTDLRLSAAQREQLDVAVGQLERAGYSVFPGGHPAAAIAALIDLAGGAWREFWNRGYRCPKDAAQPATPGALTICAGRLARQQLRGYRAAKKRRVSAEGSRG